MGIPLLAGTIRNILINPVYAGYIACGGQVHRGLHGAIVDRDAWESAAAIRDKQIADRLSKGPKETLNGLIYDCFGRSMTANRSLRRGRLTSFYRSNQSDWGRKHGVKRMCARSTETEQLVVSALQSFLCDRERLRSALTDLGRSERELSRACRNGPIASRRLETLSRDQLRSVLHGLVSRIEVSRERLRLVTRALEYEHLLEWDFTGPYHRLTEDTSRASAHILDVPCAGAIRLERFVRLPISARKSQTYRMNKQLRLAIAQARSAWAMIEENRDLSPAEIAQRNNCTLSYLMKLLRLNYLAPDIVTSILDGAQPKELTRRALIDANLPLDWVLQRKLFGFPDQPPMRTVEKW
jgi:site-specific DNA recombinase